MEKLIIASAQQQMRLFDSADGYRRELIRFLNMARSKGVKLIVFPPLAGVMATSHEIEGFRVGLLKQASARQRGSRSFWTRTRHAVAEGTAALLGASYRRTYSAVLQAEVGRLADTYTAIFADLARAFEMTIVAGSAYLQDGAAGGDGPIRHRISVFGPDGAILGRQDKVMLSPEDEGIAGPGEGWQAIETPAGVLGILSDREALYPETGRLLAYQRAEILVILGAVGNEILAAYVRQAALGHAQANRCFALTAFLVGRNYLAADEGSATTFTGKSGIYAPLEMTPRYSGILVEMGTADAEGLLTAELDRDQLQYLWEHGNEPVRTIMPVQLFAATLPALYAGGLTLDMMWRGAGEELLALPAPALAEAEAGPEPPASEVGEEPLEEFVLEPPAGAEVEPSTSAGGEPPAMAEASDVPREGETTTPPDGPEAETDAEAKEADDDAAERS